MLKVVKLFPLNSIDLPWGLEYISVLLKAAVSRL